MAFHRQVRSIELDRQAGLGYRPVLLAHGIGDGEYKVAIGGVVALAKDGGDGSRRDDQPVLQR